MLMTLFFFNLKNMNIIERHLQVCLHGIQTWSDENGFRFSKTKITCVLFCSKRNFHEDSCLHLDGYKIEVVKKAKLFDVIFFIVIDLFCTAH